MPDKPITPITIASQTPIVSTTSTDLVNPKGESTRAVEQTLSQRLLNLADKIVSIDRRTCERLKLLATALSDHANADVWAFANLAQVANPDLVASQYAASLVATDKNRLKKHESWRNASIFFPLILTWIAIADATGRFYYLVHSGIASDMSSFLYLWEDGFGGATFLTLSHVALFDVLLLTGVALFTLNVMARSNRLSTKELDAAISLRHEFDDVMADVDLVLAQRRLPQPYVSISKLEHMATILHTQIKNDRENIAEVASQKEKELSILAAFTPHLATNANKTLAAAERIEQAQEKLIKLLGDLGNPISVLDKREANLLEAIRQSNARYEGLQQYQLAVSKLLTEIARGDATLAGELKTQSRQVTDMITKFMPVVDQFAQASTDLANAQTQMLQQLSAQRGEQAKLAQAITQAGSSMENVVNRVNQSTGDMARLAQAISQTTLGLENAVIRINKSTTDIAGLLSELTKVGQTLPDVVHGLNSVISQQASNNNLTRQSSL